MRGKIVTASVFVAFALSSFYAVAEEPSPSLTATPPAISAQSPVIGSNASGNNASGEPQPERSACTRASIVNG